MPDGPSWIDENLEMSSPTISGFEGGPFPPVYLQERRGAWGWGGALSSHASPFPEAPAHSGGHGARGTVGRKLRRLVRPTQSTFVEKLRSEPGILRYRAFHWVYNEIINQICGVRGIQCLGGGQFFKKTS